MYNYDMYSLSVSLTLSVPALSLPLLLQDMASLRDFIAYARSYVHPSLSEEAGQALVQAYVGEGGGRVVGGGRGLVIWRVRRCSVMPI